MRRRSRTGSAIAGPPSKKSPAPERVSRLPGRERVSAIADGAPDMGPAGRDAAPASSLPARQGLRDLCGDGESAPTLLWAVRAFPLRQYLAGRSRAVPTPPAPPPGGPDHRALGWRRDPRRASGRAGPRCHPRLHVERFPAYAPELNPDELVWNYLKGQLANGSPDTVTELLDEMTRVTRRLRRAPALLRAFIVGSELPSPFSA